MYRIAFIVSSFCLTGLINSCRQGYPADSLPYYNNADFTPHFLSKEDAGKQVTHQISNFSFTDQYGRTFSHTQIEHKVHTANFIFTKCSGICPVMIQNMKPVQERFHNNENFEMLSFSVTPWIDSVSRLRAYADANNIYASNWHLLTGSTDKIYSLARNSYFAEEETGLTKDSTDFLHTEHVLLIDKNKKIRGIYNGTLPLQIEQLIRDIEILLKE